MYYKSEDFLVPKCPKCKAFDVTINVDDNSICCIKCGYKGKEKDTVNLQEYKEEIQAKEKESLQKFLEEDPEVFLGGIFGGSS